MSKNEVIMIMIKIALMWPMGLKHKDISPQCEWCSAISFQMCVLIFFFF